MRYRILLVVSLFISIMVSAVAFAQDDSVTATPGPSKTPSPSETPVAEVTELVTEAEDIIDIPQLSPLPRSYTQEDLSVLVGNVQRPNGIAYFDNYLYTACNGDWTMYRIDAETGQTITFVFGIRNAHQMIAQETDAGFDLWIPDFDTNQFMSIDHTASAPRMVSSENLDGPWGIANLPEERFLISNLRSDNLVIADTEGNTSIAVEGLRAPAGLIVDGDYAYVANNSSARRAIEWFPIDSLQIDEEGAVTSVSDITQPLVSGLQNTSSLVLANDGYLYFSYALGTRGVVGRVNPEECRDGGCTNEQVEIVLFTELTAPLSGLTITPDMRLFVHTIYRPEIYWVDLYNQN
ncbi:MAG: hypothetical protein Phog2KO_16320 [Phototrophicaceae bacterium]